MSKLKKIVRFSNIVRIASICLLIALAIAYTTPFVHPNHLWILPFFGLAYPLLFVLGILLILYWLLLRKFKWTLVLFFALVVGYSFLMRLFAYGAENTIPENAQTSLKIVSNNVQIFDLYDDDREQKFATRDSIFQYMIDQEADVACFQEFYNKDNPTTFPTADLFKKKFGAKEYHSRFIYKKVGRQNFGVALFSKLPVIAKGDVNFELEDDQNYNFCIFVDVVKDQDTFRIYNVHLQSFRISKIEDDEPSSSMVKGIVQKLKTAYPKRADQALRINEHIKSSPYPVIVVGDFNDTPVSFVYNQFQSHLTDAFLNCGSGIGSTYVGKMPAGRIDYLFHSPSLVSTNFEVQKRPFSDHRAISCVVSKMQ